MENTSSGPPSIALMLQTDQEDWPDEFKSVIKSNSRFLKSLMKKVSTLLSDGYEGFAMELIDKAIEEGDEKRVVLMTSKLEEYTEAGKAMEALLLYYKLMNSEDCAPNTYTYSVIIKALAGDPDPKFLGVAKECVIEMMGKGLQPSASTYTAVFEAYAGHGKTAEAEQFLEEMKANGFVADRKAMRAIRQLLDGKGQMLTSIRHVLFDDLKVDSTDSDGGDVIKEVNQQIKQVIDEDQENPKYLQRVFNIIYYARQIREKAALVGGGFLTGTTTMGMIGRSSIFLATDQRGCVTGTQFVAGDNYDKIYKFGDYILATMAGPGKLCRQMLDTAKKIIQITSGLTATNCVHLAALYAMAVIDNWEDINHGKVCRAHTLIAGWHNNEGMIYNVQSKKVNGGGLRCTWLPGLPVTTGSGGRYAKMFLRRYSTKNEGDCELISSWSIVAAALQCPKTGGNILSGKVRRNKQFLLCGPFSVLNGIYFCYPHFETLMSGCLFMVAEEFQYTLRSYESVRKSLEGLIAFSQMHLISKRNPEKLIFILRFSHDHTAMVAFQKIRFGINLTGSSQGILKFYQPTVETMKMLYEQDLALNNPFR